MHTPEKITAYIRSEPPAARKHLKQMRALVKRLAPKAREKLAWGMPTFHLEGNLLHYAAFKHHLSIFPGAEAIAHFKSALGSRNTSKGTIQIRYDEKLPVSLISRIVRYCVRSNLESARKKAPPKRKTKTRAR